MGATEIAEAIRKFVQDNFLFGSEQPISENTSFLQSGIIDSTGVMELVALVEERYGVAVKDDELIPENFDSISALSAYISRKLSVVA